MSVEVVPTPMGDPVARSLEADLLAELAARYGDDEDLTPVDAAGFDPPGGTFVVVRVDGRPAGCAGLRGVDGVTAEIKRMWVAPEQRRRGLSRLLLSHVEQVAIQQGYRYLRLETGTEQPEALALYASAGFGPIAAYGQYRDDPRTRCLAKPIGEAGPRP